MELEGALILIGSECQTNSDTCLLSAVKTWSRSKTQGFIAEDTHTHTHTHMHMHMHMHIHMPTTPLLKYTACNRDCKS